MKACYVIRVKKVCLCSSSPIDGDKITREHTLLEKRPQRDTDLLGAIFLDEQKAIEKCEYLNMYLSQKEWEVVKPAGIKNEYHVELRRFYIKSELLWD